MSEIETPEAALPGPSTTPGASTTSSSAGSSSFAPPGSSSATSSRAVTPGADGTVRLGGKPAKRATATPSGTPGAPGAPRLTRRGRIRKWDRAPQPHDWRWYVGNLGKTLIAVGLLMFGFVGYQLYGTGIETAAAQNELESDFEAQLEQLALGNDAFTSSDATDTAVDVDPGDTSTDTSASDPSASDDGAVVVPGAGDDGVAGDDSAPAFTPAGEQPAVDAVPVSQQVIPPLEEGDALARIEIPAIDVNDIVVAGVETGDLKKGPGHFPDTPLPGQLGNAAIAGHRTTYGHPFRNVDKLVPGDVIRVTTLNGVFVYRVTGQQIVSPADYQVVATTDPTVANLTLTSCHPVFTARERIVIFSELDRTESAPVGEPIINYGRPEAPAESEPPTIPGDVDLPDDAPDDQLLAADADTGQIIDDGAADGADGSGGGAIIDNGVENNGSFGDAPASGIDQLGSEQVNSGIADAFSEGWFSDPSANSQVGLWGVVLGAIAIAAYLLSRRFHTDFAGLALGLLPFMLALYFFFQNVNRLLPPHL